MLKHCIAEHQLTKLNCSANSLRSKHPEEEKQHPWKVHGLAKRKNQSVQWEKFSTYFTITDHLDLDSKPKANCDIFVNLAPQVEDREHKGRTHDLQCQYITGSMPQPYTYLQQQCTHPLTSTNVNPLYAWKYIYRSFFPFFMFRYPFMEHMGTYNLYFLWKQDNFPLLEVHFYQKRYFMGKCWLTLLYLTSYSFALLDSKTRGRSTISTIHYHNPNYTQAFLQDFLLGGREQSIIRKTVCEAHCL